MKHAAESMLKRLITSLIQVLIDANAIAIGHYIHYKSLERFANSTDSGVYQLYSLKSQFILSLSKFKA
jgi:hypothetical protein